MPEGYTEQALLYALEGIVGRNLQIRLHYGDPGDDGTENAIALVNGYEHLTVRSSQLTREGTTGARYTNNADALRSVEALGGNWGRDADTDDPISWISIWTDADNPANTDADRI